MAVRRDADAIIEAAILEIRRNRTRIGSLLPCSLTIHLPPEGSTDAPCLEIKARLRADSCDRA